MRKKMIFLSVCLILISVSITSVISINVNVANLKDDKESELFHYCSFINQVIEADYRRGFEPDLEHYAAAFGTQVGERVTIIDTSGTVLGDSYAGEMEVMDNHLNREEVREALETGEGFSSRESATFGSEFIYAAKTLRYDGETRLITRVAMEVNQLDYVKDYIYKTAIWSALAGIASAMLIGFIWSGILIRPFKVIGEGASRIACGNYDERIHLKTGDEFEALGDTINEMAKDLSVTVKEMKRADSFRREFVANVSHELKTPLTSISGFIETLQEGADEDPQVRNRFLDIISIETARLTRLIEDLLLISDIESGREVRQDNDINIRECIEEVIAAIEPLIGENKTQIEQAYSYEIYIGGNRDRFKQMMLNLIENAVKYAGVGARVQITASKHGGIVVITVADDGIGIEAEHLPRLFERFYRVDKSRSQKAKGTGLGLSIVKHVAGLLGGTVSVESVVGKGTTFTVVIPQ